MFFMLILQDLQSEDKKVLAPKEAKSIFKASKMTFLTFTKFIQHLLFWISSIKISPIVV